MTAGFREAGKVYFFGTGKGVCLERLEVKTTILGPPRHFNSESQ
jgi:hypothetical protein